MLEGKNIILRPMKQEDIDEYILRTGDPKENGAHFPLIVRSKPVIQKEFNETGYWEHNKGRLMIIDKEENLVGFVSFFPGAWYMQGFEIGYQIFKREDRGKGYTSEALKLFSAYLFEEKQIQRLQLCINPDNIGSIKVGENCGFKIEGTLRNIAYTRGKYHDLVIMSLLRDECPSLNEALGL